MTRAKGAVGVGTVVLGLCFALLPFSSGIGRVLVVLTVVADSVVLVGLAIRWGSRYRRSFADWAAAQGWSYQPMETVRLGWPDAERADVVEGVNVVRGDFVAFTSEGAPGPAGWGIHQNDLRSYVVIPVHPCEEWVHVARGEHQITHHSGTKVEFESEAFNRAFDVWTSSTRFATNLLTPQALEAVLTSDADALTLDNGFVMMRYRKPHSPKNLAARHDQAMAVRSATPQWAWREGQHDAGDRFRREQQ